MSFMRSIVALSLAVAAATSGMACSGGGGSDRGGGATTSTIDENPTKAGKAPSECALTSVDEVRTIFGDGVSATLDDDRCRFDIEGGTVRFQVWPGKETASDLARGGVPIPNLGDLALWAPGKDGDGGVLAVTVKDRVLVFEIVVDGLDPDVAKARLLGWAELIVDRYTEEGVATTTQVPGGEDPVGDPCRLLTDDQLEQLLGRPPKPTSHGDTCSYNLGKGSTIVIGPKTGPVSVGATDAISRTSTVDGKVTEWTRTEVELGDEAVLLTNPASPGTVDLFIVDDGDLYHVGVNGFEAERSTYIAKAAGKQLIR